MTVKHGKKDYYQILLDPHRSELLKAIVSEKGIKANSLIRDLIYEQLEKKVPKHIYKSSYPIRILNLSKIISLFEDSGYKLNYKNFDNENIDNFDYQSICFEIK